MRQYDKVEIRLFGPLAVGLVLVIVSALLAVFLWAGSEDRSARLREELLVRNGVETRIEELEKAAAAEVVWDDAVANLDNRFDPKWAETNIGQYFSNTGGFERAFVVDGGGRPLFAMANGETQPAVSYDEFAQVTSPLLQKVHQGEAKRGPYHTTAPSKTMISRPIQASDIVKTAKGTFLVTATLVQPDFGNSLPAGSKAPVVITADAVDAAFLNLMTKRFLLNRPRLGQPPADSGEASVAMRNTQGEAVATMTWTPEMPGQGFLKTALPAVLAGLGVMSAMAFIFFRRGRAAASSLLASEARAKHMAYHDALTGLGNRALFMERLSQDTELAKRGKATFAVMCIDLDRFKTVNDTLGHQCGDELIQEAARRLKSVCRASDTLARLGGDEFAIIQADEPRGAAVLAERIVAALNGPVDLSGGRVFLGASVGVTQVDGQADGAEALRQADVALYRAKASGRGQFCFFEPEMDAAMKVRRAVEADLRVALAEGGLHMAYQPQVDKHGKVTGVEALCRWRHAERGMIAPGYFVPIAEECGLIDKLSLFTLRQAFTDSLRWPHLKVAVNVSAKQLASPNFPDEVAQLLVETGAQAAQLELEITEGLLLGDDLNTHQALDRLREMGFSLALDDFGTGYSSLAYLNRYPIDKIKIDRSFISHLGEDAEADAVVKAIVKLAKALNLSVIAEGVETASQRAALQAVGCTEVQGFIYSPAVAVGEIDALVSGRLTPAEEAA